MRSLTQVLLGKATKVLLLFRKTRYWQPFWPHQEAPLLLKADRVGPITGTE